MKAIQISSIQKTANIQVIELDTSFVVNALEAAIVAKNIVDDNKRAKRKYNSEKSEWEDVLAEDGSSIYEYNKISAQVVEESILPFLSELRKALLEG